MSNHTDHSFLSPVQNCRSANTNWSVLILTKHPIISWNWNLDACAAFSFAVRWTNLTLQAWAKASIYVFEINTLALDNTWADDMTAWFQTSGFYFSLTAFLLVFSQFCSGSTNEPVSYGTTSIEAFPFATRGHSFVQKAALSSRLFALKMKLKILKCLPRLASKKQCDISTFFLSA